MTPQICGMCQHYCATFANFGRCEYPVPIAYQLMIDPIVLSTTDADCCPRFENNPNYHDPTTLLDEKMKPSASDVAD